MSLPNQAELLTFDYHHNGIPFAYISKAPTPGTLDYHYNGLPFFGSAAAAGELSKVLYDTITLSEESVRAVNKRPHSVMSVVDLCAKQLSRALSDSTTGSDDFQSTLHVVINYILGLDDGVVMSEAMVRALRKAAADTVGMADTVTSKRVSRRFTDGISVADAMLGKAVFKPRQAELLMTDSAGKRASRPIGDTVSMADARGGVLSRINSDNLNAVDVLTMAFEKRRSDTAFAYDALFKGVSAIHSDTVISEDIIGLILCDFKYILVSGTWKTISQIDILIGGAWKNVTELEVIIGSVWNVVGG